MKREPKNYLSPAVRRGMNRIAPMHREHPRTPAAIRLASKRMPHYTRTRFTWWHYPRWHWKASRAAFD